MRSFGEAFTRRPTIGDLLSKLDKYWKGQFDDHPPAAHLLREANRDRWLRFHSLPNSKRYADSPCEWSMLLARHNAVIAELAEDGSQITLLTTAWSDSVKPVSPHAAICKLPLSVVHWQTFLMLDEVGRNDGTYWHVFHSEVVWKHNALDAVLRLVADNQISNVMLFDRDRSWLVHPYDGGIDVILGSIDEVERIAQKFDAWRSHRSDGL